MHFKNGVQNAALSKQVILLKLPRWPRSHILTTRAACWPPLTYVSYLLIPWKLMFKVKELFYPAFLLLRKRLHFDGFSASTYFLVRAVFRFRQGRVVNVTILEGKKWHISKITCPSVTSSVTNFTRTCPDRTWHYAVGDRQWNASAITWSTTKTELKYNSLRP